MTKLQDTMFQPDRGDATSVHTAPSCILPANDFLIFIWLDAMQEDSIVLTRVHLKEHDDKHQSERRTSGAMVTDCNAGHVWFMWIRTSLLIQFSSS